MLFYELLENQEKERRMGWACRSFQNVFLIWRTTAAIWLEMKPSNTTRVVTPSSFTCDLKHVLWTSINATQQILITAHDNQLSTPHLRWSLACARAPQIIRTSITDSTWRGLKENIQDKSTTNRGFTDCNYLWPCLFMTASLGVMLPILDIMALAESTQMSYQATLYHTRPL